MESIKDNFPFRRVLSLEQLIGFWEDRAIDEQSALNPMARQVLEQLEAVPALRGEIRDLSLLETHSGLVNLLMSAIFPSARRSDYVSAALVPYQMVSVFTTEGFDRLGILEDFHSRTTITGTPVDTQGMLAGKAVSAYQQILEHHYHISDTPNFPIIYSHVDSSDGLERYYNLTFDSRYAVPRATGPIPDLSEEQLGRLSADPMNLDLWMEILPPEHFEFYGFVIINAVDVTAPEVHSALKNDLLEKDAFTSPGSVDRIQARLRTLLRLPELRVGLISLVGDDFESMSRARRIGRSLLLSKDAMPKCTHRNESVYRDAFDSEEPIVISDMRACKYCTGLEHHLLEQDVLSFMLAPLRYEGKLIGLLELASPRKDAITAMSSVRLMDVISLFATAMKRTLDEQEDRVQAMMKRKYTSIHPVVEWKFRKSIFESLTGTGEEASKDSGIVFDDVFPLYGLSDIRDSSINRAAAIQSDLIEQLGLALAIVVEASSYRPLPALDEIGFRISQFVDATESSPTSDVEFTALEFLRLDVEPLFDMLASFGESVRKKIETYREALDPKLQILYRSRRDYENSVTIINETISSHLDSRQVVAQSMFPHYFEKYKTDGVDYNIYVGQSLIERQTFDPLYLHNLRVWQLMTTCGIVWELDRIRATLPVALDTAHLLLVQNVPLSIRFREDEKKFDVDGAYNVRYEIVKKRIDKARIRGSEERLTQPGHIAIVYSQSREAAEYRRYLEYLLAAGYLEEGSVEEFLLEDLQGANGLRALRVKVSEARPDMELRLQPERVLDLAQSLSPARTDPA